MDNKIIIRTASAADAPALLKIYRPYVENTAITFEYDVPSTEEFASRIQHTLRKYPYLVAEEKGTLLGYAYAGPFHERPAYDWAVETSIYVDQSLKHRGIGRRLHDALETALREQGILNMNACIAYPPKEDEHLDKNSVEFHTHMGYRLVGEFHKCGYKFNHWYNMVWMEKLIGEHLTVQEPPKFPLHRLQLLPPFQHQLQRKQMLLLLLSQQQPQQFRQFPKTHYRQPLHSRRLL